MAVLIKEKSNKSNATMSRIGSRDDSAEPIVLDDDAFDALSDRIENPPAPNARLRALFAKR